MRLLYVLPEYLPQTGGGLITFYRWLLPELVRRGHEVTVLVGSGVTASAEGHFHDGVRVRYLPLESLRRRAAEASPLEGLPELRRHLAAGLALRDLAGGGAGFDVVETTDWGLLALPWLAARERPPLVVQLHGSIGQIDRRDPQRGQALMGLVARLLEANALPLAEELQTYSAANAADWRELCGHDVRVIPPALAPGPAGEEPRSGGVAVGRIQKWKGTETLCAALTLLGAEAPRVEWIGRDTSEGLQGGSFSTTLKHRYPEVWGRSLLPVGALPPSEVAKRQRRAAFAVVPSCWDVFNFTVVEAMAAATPVIVSTGAGAADLVEDGRNGFVVPAEDAEELATALRRVASATAAERTAIGGAARETVLVALDPARVAEQRLARYELVRSEGPRPTRASWLEELFSPGSSGREPLELLHQLPLAGILRHAGRRVLAKAGFR